MDNPISANLPQSSEKAVHSQTSYIRFDLSQRIEHILFLLSFSLLGLTGLVQKYSVSPVSQAIMEAFGGIETTRLVHHGAAFVMMWVTLYHIISVLYRVYVLRVPWAMLPVMDDFKHLYQDVLYFIGKRKHRGYYGRYNYAEKAEYLAVVWGTIIMGLTGFMMWNPITTTKYLPGEVIPAAKVAHGLEAVLAVLAIFIWHMYHVHIKRFNKSMFTGKITHEEMEEEHPAELAEIVTGEHWQRPDSAIIRKRQQRFVPVAALLGLVLSGGIMWFINVEPETAISTIPPGETAEAFVPVTPTPRPTLAPTPTPELGAGVSPDSWDGKYSALFQNRCGSCHGNTAVGGLSIETYQSALKGGNSGPGIVPGNPDASAIVQIQSAGGHPGQLTIDELNEVINWILAGAPER
jgi:cytochrome b subunit of formate dehydrogenase/mono/diheme cytochrome c family protein